MVKGMTNKDEQLKKLYEDAVESHMLGRGFTEDRARVEAQKISKIIVRKI
jgi:hypothetical protein